MRASVRDGMPTAAGLEYLHTRRVVHFDVKTDNLLGDLRDLSNPVVKIADMGLSKRKATTFVSGNMRGTLPWMAPELFPNATQVGWPCHRQGLETARMVIMLPCASTMARQVAVACMLTWPQALGMHA